MDERAYSAFQRFRTRGSIYILVPALAVSLVVAAAIVLAFLGVFGRSMASGLNGVVAGSLQSPSSLENPQALGSLQSDLNALLALGQFATISVKDLDGEPLAFAGKEGDAVGPGLDNSEREAATSSKLAARVGWCECGELEFMVVAPLTRPSESAPYGVIRAHRDFALIAPFILVTVSVIVIVIMAGAFVATAMLRRMVGQAEAALRDDERVIDALDRRLKRSLHDLEEHSIGTLQALVTAVDARDTYTAHHSLNVSDYACAIARQMGLHDEIPVLERAGLLHDVGKIGVAEGTLLKPGRLTPEEYASIKEHSEIGARIVEMVPFLSDIVPIIRHHHERWDGRGYPDGLTGEQSPLLSRVLGVADALDAMTSDRSYRSALSVREARVELVKGSGGQFDPQVVGAALQLIDSGALMTADRRAVHALV